MENYNNEGNTHSPQLNNVSQEEIDLKAYYRPAIKFYEILLGWKMKEVDEDSKKGKKIQTPSQLESNKN